MAERLPLFINFFLPRCLISQVVQFCVVHQVVLIAFHTKPLPRLATGLDGAANKLVPLRLREQNLFRARARLNRPVFF
jgi:hypothetical protein